MRILFCPTHYVYGDSWQGSEIHWAFEIAHRIGSRHPGSVVVTGRSTTGPKPYDVVELTSGEARINFGLVNALAFNVRYTVATFRALRRGPFDLVHHVLPFAIGRTYNLAAVRHGSRMPFLIGPVQPPIEPSDTDVDARDLSKVLDSGRTASARHAIARRVGALALALGPLAFSRLSRRTIARAAAVVAVNEEARALLVRGGAPPERVVVIPPGVDTQRYRPPPVGGKPNSSIELLSVSRLLKRKNVDLILRAFAKVAADSPRATLRIVGDGAERERLQRLAQVLGVREKVTFAGAVPHVDVPDEYRRAHIFVNASSAEGFATTCVEALASGLPVVSTKVGGFMDAVEDGRSGFLVETPDADELAARLGILMADPSLIAQFADRARKHAEQEYDWDKAVIPRYLDLYDRVIRERS